VSDLRPPLDVLFGPIFGTDAIVTPRDGSPIDTTVVWQSPPTTSIMVDPPVGDLRYRVAVRRDHVAALPVGSTILAARVPEYPDPHLFTVDLVEDLDPDVFYAQAH
jgi:hypothetical protein